MHGLYNWDFIRFKIARDVDQAAAEAHAEIKAMGEFARRSIGPLTRRKPKKTVLTLREAQHIKSMIMRRLLDGPEILSPYRLMPTQAPDTIVFRRRSKK